MNAVRLQREINSAIKKFNHDQRTIEMYQEAAALLLKLNEDDDNDENITPENLFKCISKGQFPTT
tara:strand:- start:213 stop:407 length:195 start_codon:yes stop_codon:yes gene_type:complete